MADARLTLGSTPLLSAARETDLLAASGAPVYVIEALEGTSFGNAVPTVTDIRTALQDGSLRTITDFQNRTGQAVVLKVSSLTHDGLGQGEKALVAESKVPGVNTLAWTPSESLAAVGVFDVDYSYPNWQFDDFNEIKRAGSTILRRFFTLDLDLLPFVHDQALTVVTATSAPVTPPTNVSISNGSSLTNWTGSPNTPILTASGTRVTESVPLPGGGARTRMALRYAASIDVTTSRFVFVDYDSTGGTPSVPIAAFANRSSASALDGTAMDNVANMPSPTAGLMRAYFAVPASFPTSLSSVTFTLSRDVDDFINGNAFTFNIDQLSRTDLVPALGTNRQRARSAAVGGSARTRATIVVTADATKTLGDLTMVYTRSATTGFQPPLQPYATATGTADAAIISGQRATIGTAAKTFRVPARLLKEALHSLVSRTRATTLGTYVLTYTAALKTSAGATLPESTQSITGSVTVVYPAANTWQTNEVGALQLPTVPVGADSTHVMEITLQSFTTAGATTNLVELDEAWLFDTDNGTLSWLETTGLTRLEIRPADLTNPEPSYWGGTVDGGAATGLVRADYRTVPSVSATASNGGSFGQHFIEPGTVEIFTVTSATEGSTVTFNYQRSFAHNVSA